LTSAGAALPRVPALCELFEHSFVGLLKAVGDQNRDFFPDSFSPIRPPGLNFDAPRIARAGAHTYHVKVASKNRSSEIG